MSLILTPYTILGRKDKQYRAWMREENSCVLVHHGDHACTGPVEVCHIKSRATGGYDLMNTYPGCRAAHQAQHQLGFQGIWEVYGENLPLDAILRGQRYLDAHLGYKRSFSWLWGGRP